jgi:phytoene synthase
MPYAAEFLKTHDPDRYFATLLLTGAERDAIQALYAFSADVASVRDRVSEPAPGEIRLQWWTDALKGDGHGDIRRNPLAAELLDAIARYRLPAGSLLRLIAARRFDLYDDPMPDLPTFEGYAGETVSVLYQLAAMILNDGDSVETGDAAGHLGVAQALIGHLRAFGHNASRGKVVLPWSILAANGVTEEEVFSGTVSEGLLAGLGQISDIARSHLDKALVAIALLPRKLRPAFATIALLLLQLRATERQAESPFSAPGEMPDWQKIGTLWLWRLQKA